MLVHQLPLSLDRPTIGVADPQATTTPGGDAGSGVVASAAELVLDLSFLDEGGFLWRIRTHGFGLLAASLDWTTLGVRLPEDCPVHLRPGHTDLLPQPYVCTFRSLRDRLGAMLKERGYTPPVIAAAYHGGWTWLPRQHHLAWDADYAAVQAGLAAQVRRVAQDYSVIRAQMRAYFQTLAERAVVSLRANGVAIARPEHLCAEIVERSLRKVPSPEQLETLRVERIPRTCRLGSEIERELAALQREQAGRVAAEAEVRLQEVRTEEALSRERLETTALAERLERERQAEEAYRCLERQALEEALSTRVAQAVSVVDDVLGELHRKLHAALVGTQESIARHGTLTAKASRDIKGFLALYERINIFEQTHPGVRELETAIGELRGVLARRGKRTSTAYDVAALRAAVDRVVEVTAARGRLAVGEPTRLGALEL